jgi:surface polysaccharide O-acyltransferase-like enzyme
MLFIFHTSVIFDSFEKDFYVRSVTHGLVADVFMLITFFWYMPLLFFLAGASAYFSLVKRTNLQFLKERVTRLLIPFLFGVLIVIPPQGYFAKLWHAIPTGGYLNHCIAFFTHVTDFSGNDGNLTPAHLWFILFLFLISALLLPLLRYFEQEKGQQILLKIKPVLLSPWGLVIVSVLLFLMRIIPDIGGKNIFYFGLIYLFGAIVYSDKDYIEKLCARKGRAAIGLLVLSPVLVWVEYKYTALNGNVMLWFKAAVGMLEVVMMIFAIIALVGYGTKYLNRGGKVLTYLNEACFPIYILHQTVLIAVAYYVLTYLHAPIAAQAAVIILVTAVLTFALYEGIKRVPPLRFLFGIKKRQPVK